MQISFYVLSARFAIAEGVESDSIEYDQTALDSEAVLNFVCQLTQTVLVKSDHSLIVVDDHIDRLKKLDTHLWSFEPTSFIPHNLVTEPIQADMLSAPVTLTPSLPDGFDGVVLNLATKALPLDNTCLPDRLLEIITPDKISKEQGRDKYRAYRNLGFKLTYFPID